MPKSGDSVVAVNVAVGSTVEVGAIVFVGGIGDNVKVDVNVGELIVV